MIGIHSSRRPVSERIIRVFAWPRSPRKITSWPASSAFSSCGMTVCSYPSTPANSGSPALIFVTALARISSFTGRETQPDAFSSPSVLARSAIRRTYPRPGTTVRSGVPSVVGDVGCAVVEVVDALERLDRGGHDAAEVGDDPLPVAVQDRPRHRPRAGPIGVHVLAHARPTQVVQGERPSQEVLRRLDVLGRQQVGGLDVHARDLLAT